MRIISDFHDFYDCGMHYGMDPDLIYVRKKEMLDGRNGPRKLGPYWHKADVPIRIISHTVGFCGKVWNCYEMQFYQKDKLVDSAFCYDIDSMDKFIEKHCKKRQIEVWRGEPDGWRGAKYYWSKQTYDIYYRRANFVKAFKQAEERRGMSKHSFTKRFQDNQVPIFVNNVLNACLKDYEFYKVMDPYTAYQELQMYWSSGMAPAKPIPKVSDADMLICKGFDPKSSFRKEPGGKKRKRKKKK